MYGHASWKNRRLEDGTPVGTNYYVCAASITK
jgi:hypothetical protein